MQTQKGLWQTFSDLLRSILSCVWPLGFVFLIMWRVLIVRQNTVDHDGVDIHLLFYCSFGIASLIVALVNFYGKQPREIPKLGLCVFCVVCMGISSCLLTWDVFSGSRATAVLGAVLGGLATISGMLGWGSYFKEQPLQLSVAYIFIVYMANFFLMPLCRMLSPIAIIPVLIVCSLGAPMCLLMSQRSSTANRVAGGQQLSDANAQDAKREIDNVVLTGMRQKLPPLWNLVIAFAVYSFVLTLRSPVTYDSNQLVFFIFSYAALAVTLLLFWALIIRNTYLSLERILQLLLLVFAIGFLLLPFSSGLSAEMLSSLFFVTTGLIFMLSLIVVTDVAHSSTMHPFVIVGIWGACYGCPRLLLFLVNAALSPLGYSVDTMAVSSVLALFGLFVAFFLISRQTTGTRQFLCEFSPPYRRESENLGEPLPVGNWEDIAREHKLTDREREVFILLCKGHSKRYISEHLYITENTVKAHQKKIYAKIGVHSKLDLEEKIWPE